MLGHLVFCRDGHKVWTTWTYRHVWTRDFSLFIDKTFTGTWVFSPFSYAVFSLFWIFWAMPKNLLVKMTVLHSYLSILSTKLVFIRENQELNLETQIHMFLFFSLCLPKLQQRYNKTGFFRSKYSSFGFIRNYSSVKERRNTCNAEKAK